MLCSCDAILGSPSGAGGSPELASGQGGTGVKPDLGRGVAMWLYARFIVSELFCSFLETGQP